ncbi:hypothetical protein [Hymenobacter sp. APR13]|uniref:hypothetical protein n=1 Tax=Hymenobacter sp. APR13 TaxID=1356852 RepID=UPI000ADF889B|nr:hypothetical protein [Hymenobacter sp. APR13]
MEERTLSLLAEQIGQLHAQTQRAAAQQVNYWLTVRNWLIGWHIAEYEQGGSDRAEYGERLCRSWRGSCTASKGSQNGDFTSAASFTGPTR